jgi:branched-chain amino acid transport system substrate-binding protein
MQQTFSLLCAAVLSLCLVACNGDSADDGAAETIKIGHFASTTGKQATFGIQVDNGVRLAVEEINANGGVLGKQIELITEDTQSKTDQSITAVEKLIGRDHVVAIIGEVASSNSLAAAPIAQREQIPMVSPASTNEKVTIDEKTGEALPWIFRICFIDPFQGAGLASFTYNDLDAKNVAVLIDKANAYSVGLAEGFQKTFTDMGGTIAVEQTYEGGQTDFRAQLTAIKGTNPDAIFLPGYYTEVSLIAQQARDLGITVPLVGGDGWDSPELTKGAAKEALEGTFFSNHYSEEDTSARVQEFIKKYQAKYNEAPGAMSALGYDAMMILAHVIEQAGDAKPESIRTGLENLTDFEGVTGAITINEQHNATKPMVMLKIHDGKFTYYSTIQPDFAESASGSAPAEAAEGSMDTSATEPEANGGDQMEAPAPGDAPADTN